VCALGPNGIDEHHASTNRHCLKSRVLDFRRFLDVGDAVCVDSGSRSWVATGEDPMDAAKLPPETATGRLLHARRVTFWSVIGVIGGVRLVQSVSRAVELV